MRISKIVTLPFDAVAVATGAKSFRHNAVLGSPYLNARGLHTSRVKTADRLATARRRRLEHMVPAAHRDRFAECGYVQVENVLPDDIFLGLSQEVDTTPLPARELKQGGTVTRFITLSPETLRSLPYLDRAIKDAAFQGLMRYVGSANADPLVTLHTVLTNPVAKRADPQSSFHSDTFHPTSKGWLFLRDVDVEDGPFSYVPGSHRMTAGRLEWEYEQSLSAQAHKNGHHAGGSFRATQDEIKAMGYPEPVGFPVKANTLVVADTHGFHARQPSARKSTRVALYGSLRASPFNPLAGPDIMDIPGLRGRKGQMLDLYRSAVARVTGKPESQPLVGDVLAAAPAVR
ncbi:MAG: phytanoyl-CoA dioxygenase family protein [Pseudomonadota bacterium]